MAVLVDTGVFVSAADHHEPRHEACAALLRAHRAQLLVPAPVVADTAWLIESRLGPAAETRFLTLITTDDVAVVDLGIADYQRCIALITPCADMGLGMVDSSVVTVAENLKLTTIATLNQRDFRVVRPAHRDAFDLIP